MVNRECVRDILQHMIKEVGHGQPCLFCSANKDPVVALYGHDKTPAYQSTFEATYGAKDVQEAIVFCLKNGYLTDGSDGTGFEKECCLNLSITDSGRKALREYYN